MKIGQATVSERRRSEGDTAQIDLCRRGDQAAFREVVLAHQDRLFNVCLRMIGNRTEAEDLVQEAFVKAFTSLAGFDGRASFYTWLYRIAVNLCLSRRRSTRHLACSLDEPHEEARRSGSAAASLSARNEASPLRQAAQREEHRLILAALEELDDEHRTVVVLRDIESLDYGEIAEILEIPAGTVKSRLHRARMALRERLRPLLGED